MFSGSRHLRRRLVLFKCNDICDSDLATRRHRGCQRHASTLRLIIQSNIDAIKRRSLRSVGMNNRALIPCHDIQVPWTAAKLSSAPCLDPLPSLEKELFSSCSIMDDTNGNGFATRSSSFHSRLHNLPAPQLSLEEQSVRGLSTFRQQYCTIEPTSAARQLS
jgi:hypothetical protein